MARTALTLPEAFPETTFRPSVGATELEVAEAVGRSGSRPERVTRLLQAVYDTIAGGASTSEVARSVCAAGREWLLQRASDRYGGLGDWFETECVECGERYDLAISLGSAGRKEAGAEFPVIEVETSLGARSFEAPNGWHEEALARGAGTTADPARSLVGLCGLAENATEESEQFSSQDIQTIDLALEEAAPEIADSATAVCPSCGSETYARLEPLRFGFPRELDVMRDVHLLAGAYSWSESQVLDLTSRRRSTYAALIRNERGSGRRGVSRLRA